MPLRAPVRRMSAYGSSVGGVPVRTMNTGQLPVYPAGTRPYAPAGSRGGLAGSTLSAWTSAQNAARRANEQRYQEILGGYRGRYGDVMGELEGVGGQTRADILAGGRSLQAGMLQESVGRGLAGTTILPGLRMAAQRETAGQLGRYGENLAQLRAGTMADLLRDTLMFQERRTDEYPDAGMLSGLLASYGQAQGLRAGPTYAPRGTAPATRQLRAPVNYGATQPAFAKYKIGPYYNRGVQPLSYYGHVG